MTLNLNIKNMENFRNVILDASSLIAFVYAEQGHEVVADILHCSVMSTVNISEVIKYMINYNVQINEIDKLFSESLSKIIDFNRKQSYMAAELVQYAKKYGLSFTDRACIALSLDTDYPIFTADKIWKKLEIENVDINLIR